MLDAQTSMIIPSPAWPNTFLHRLLMLEDNGAQWYLIFEKSPIVLTLG